MRKAFISRDLQTNSVFYQKLTVAGWEVHGQSLIRFSPVSFKTIPRADWLFLYSSNGVRFFFQNYYHPCQDSPGKKKGPPITYPARWAALGPGTAKALQKYGISPDFIGNGNPAETALAFQKLAGGQTVLFIRAKNSRQSIQSLLEKHLNALDLIVYENIAKTTFTLPHFDCLVFTSPLNVRTYFKKYPLQKDQQIVAIGNTTAKALADMGITKYRIAQQPTEKALVEAVINS